jgi:beta-glucanase (GH16 family)
MIAVVVALAMSLPAEWKLVWSDDFNKSGLPDPAKWGYDVGFIANNEKQWYVKDRPENARVENGKLIIEARKDGFAGHPISSARLLTRNTQTWTYGRFEIKAKIPTGRGAWPAIWMLGQNVDKAGWPGCGELDIMENVGYEPDVVHATIHTSAYNHMRGTQKAGTISPPAPYKDFHVYAMEWFPDHIDFFFDDRKYFTYVNDGKGDPATWPFDKPQFLILNVAIGGDWGGSKGVDESILPCRMEVEYVRVYQKKT